MKKTLILIAGSMISIASAATVTYSYDDATGNLTDTATGQVFGTLALSYVTSGSTASLQTANSSYTSVTTGSFNITLDLNAEAGNNVDVTYTFNPLIAGYAVQEAQWGSGIGNGVLAGNSGSLGSTDGTAVGTPNDNEITLSSLGLTLTAGTLNSDYTTSGSGSSTLEINGADSNTNQLVFGTFGEYWSSNTFASNTSTLNYANSSTGNNNIQNERLGLELCFVVPEPSSASLFGLGALGLLARRRR